MANAPQYDAAAARADKMLEPDGSIQTHSGTIVSGPNPALATAYSQATARADKLLQPDGSITTSGSGTGGSTPPGGATGQVQYNNAGVFAGATNVTTDGTTLQTGTMGVGMANMGGSAIMTVKGGNANIALGSGVVNDNNMWMAATTVGATIHSSVGMLISSQAGAKLGYAGSGALSVFAGPTHGVNYTQIQGAIAGATPSIAAAGSDTNISLNHNIKGTGSFNFGDGTNQWLTVSPPSGAFNGGGISIRPNGVSGGALISAPASPLALTCASGNSVTVTYAGGGTPMLSIPINASVTANGFTLNGNTAGNPPSIGVAGTDTNISIKLSPKGAGAVILPVFTVATLPAAVAGLQGAKAFVSDATAPSFLGTLTGGGSVFCPVFCTGSAWLAG